MFQCPVEIDKIRSTQTSANPAHLRQFIVKTRQQVSNQVGTVRSLGTAAFIWPHSSRVGHPFFSGHHLKFRLKLNFEQKYSYEPSRTAKLGKSKLKRNFRYTSSPSDNSNLIFRECFWIETIWSRSIKWHGACVLTLRFRAIGFDAPETILHWGNLKTGLIWCQTIYTPYRTGQSHQKL